MPFFLEKIDLAGFKNGKKAKTELSDGFLSQFGKISGDNECVLFKSESQLWLFAHPADESNFIASAQNILRAEIGASLQDLERQTVHKHGSEVVRQFLFLAIGMESSGAPAHDLQSFRKQFDLARSHSLVGPTFLKLYQRGLWLNEKVRLELNLQLRSAMKETVLSDLAMKIFGNLKRQNALILANSESCKPYVEHLSKFKMAEIVLAGEDSVLSQLSQAYGCRFVEMEKVVAQLPQTDLILLFDHSLQKHLLDLKISKVMQKRRNAPLLVVSLFDLNGHKDADPFSKLYNVFSYTNDDLERIVNENLKEQQKLNTLVNQLIQKEIDDLYKWLNSEDKYRFGNIVGKSDAMQRILELIARIAQTDISVLIDGESGTGKELIARSIHEHSAKAKNPFIPVNCGAIPEGLLESELFGHIKGSFTGATDNKKGLLAEAENGTIFLDEIGEITMSTQVKLLRFLQEGEVKPVGSAQQIQLNVRVIAATNRDLKMMVENGVFRQDLYYRLNVIQVTLPPLRDRKDDIAPLLTHFIRKYARQFHKNVYGLEPAALQLLEPYDWPGNIRELENAIERAVALCAGDLITCEDLPPSLLPGGQGSKNDAFGKNMTLKELEKRHIAALLHEHDWNYDLVTDILGIGRTTLWRKMKEYDISN